MYSNGRIGVFGLQCRLNMIEHTHAIVKQKTAAGPAWIDAQVAADAGLASEAEQHACLESLWADSAAPSDVLKDDPTRSTVTRHRQAGRVWLLKRYHIGSWRLRLLHPLRKTPAWREWAGAKQLRRLNRRCNPPWALVQVPRGQVLVFEYVAGEAVHRLLSGEVPTTPAFRRDLARRIGRQLGAMIAAGWNNRDHKVSNLIADAACLKGGAEPVIIDPLGVVPLRGRDQIDRVLAMMIRTTLRAGPFSVREGMALLKGVQEASSCCRGPLAPWAREILAQWGGVRN